MIKQREFFSLDKYTYMQNYNDYKTRAAECGRIRMMNYNCRVMYLYRFIIIAKPRNK